MTISDETLTALADGELDATEAARIRRAIGQNPELAARFASFAETRALLSASAGESEAEAVPAQLIEAAKRLGGAMAKNSSMARNSSSPAGNAGQARMAARPAGSGVISPSSHGEIARPEGTVGNDNVGASRQRQRLAWPTAIAASVALAIGGSAGYLVRTVTAPPGSAQTADSAPGLATSPAVGARLSELATGETGEFTESGRQRRSRSRSFQRIGWIMAASAGSSLSGGLARAAPGRCASHA